jgi:hypothetical protein
MSFESDGNEAMDAPDAASDDLGNVLSEGEPDFVVEEPKKPLSRGTLAIAGVLALCGAGTYFMYLHNGPQKASAASAQVAEADTAISQFLSTNNIKAMKEMLENTQKVVQRFLAYPARTQVPVGELHTNPFRMAARSAEGPDQEASSKRRREEDRSAVLKTVQAMQLQSVIHSGSRRACMINNALYQEGQKVDGLTIEQIVPNAVIVRSGAYRFELRMHK